MTDLLNCGCPRDSRPQYGCRRHCGHSSCEQHRDQPHNCPRRAVTETDRPLPADPHTAWSGYCLIGDHLLCEHPDMCGCTECGHPTAVDDDHNQRDQEQP